MSMGSKRVGSWATLLVASGLIVNCGGGGGSSSAGGKSASFLLNDVKYGRLIDDGVNESLVSPLTTAQVDPITGDLIPGTLEPLAVGVDVFAPQSLGLGTGYLPRVVPRNAVLQLEFSAPVAAASVVADTINGNGALVTAGSVQVRLEDGTPVPVEVRLVGARTIWINPVANGQVGFPASPVDFGPSGEPRADATGYLKLRLPRTGANILRSTGGAFLGQRSDRLGEVATPIGVNPGNRVLDFIAQNQLIPTNETFNGFLPDLSIPRIVRIYDVPRTFDTLAGDSATATSLNDVSSNDNTSSNGGLGEWAGASLVLRPGTSSEETLSIVSNDGDTLVLSTAFATQPQNGDAYELKRTEYFEPDLTDPIDPLLFDADNPENLNNSSLANFVEVYEIDAAGNAVAGPTSLRTAVPSFSELRVRFSEPMADDSFRQWETFRVSLNPDGGETQELLTEVFLDSTQTVATIRPARVDQAAGTFQITGWGKNTKNLQLTISTIPRATFLQQFLTTAEYDSFLDLGFRGVLDLGGQPLGFPLSRFDSASPAIRFFTTFTSAETASTQPVPPVVSSWGVMVHRMRGRPVTGLDPATGKPGVGFRDQTNYYLPIADVNLQTNGLLAGSPVVYITKIHDEFFPPPIGQFSKLFNGLPEPITTNLTAQNSAHDGARFQSVFRDIDCSPNSLGLAGTLLDLYRVSWAPIGGNVSTDSYDNISVHCAHSPIRPNSANDTAAATYPQSGLGVPFDYATWVDEFDGGGNDPCAGTTCSSNDGPHYWDTLVTVVQPGTKYKITQSNLFTPPFDGNAWHPWPTFDVRFQYNNGDTPTAEKDLIKSINDDFTCQGGNPWVDYRDYNSDPFVDNKGGDSLLFEVRIRPQQGLITGLNGFSYVIGCLIDASGKPDWRAHSEGSPTSRLQPDNINTSAAARCAVGNQTSATPNPGDSSRYLGVFDYVKTTSRITSPYVRVFPSGTLLPDYFPVIVDPPVSSQPVGTSVTFEFEGATTIKGASGTGFSTSVDICDTKPNVAFRATLTGNISTLLLPNCDTVAIPYLRPSGT